MKKILLLLFLLQFQAFYYAQGIGYGCPETIDQQNTSINLGSTGVDQYQVFTAGTTGTLTGFDFETNGCLAYTYTLTIYAGSGIGGSVLYTGVFTNPGVCNNWQMANIPVSTGPSLTSGNNYTARLQSASNMQTTVNSLNLYLGGVYYSNVYGTQILWDLNFRTRMQTSVAYPPAAISAAGSLTVCAGGTVALNANPGPYSFQWYNTSGIIAGQSGQSYTAGASDSYAAVYTNTVTGCYATSNTLAVVAAPIPTTVANYTICNGNSLTLTSIPAGTANWNNSATTLSITVSPNVFTTYFVQAIAPTGCITETLSDVYVNASPSVNVNAFSATVTLGNLQTNNSDFATVYFPFTDPLPANARIFAYEFNYDGVDQGWGGSGCYLGTTVSNDGAGGATLSHTPTNYNYLVPTSAPNYTYGGTNYVGLSFCGWSGWQGFANNTKLIIHYDFALIPLCAGQSTTLTAIGAGSYVWSPAITNGVGFTPSATTVYSVTGSYTNGCQATNVVTVVVNPKPTLTVTGSFTTCAGNTISQTVSGADTYTWSSGSTTANETFVPNGTINYTIAATNTLTGCSTNSTYAVNSVARPVITVPNYTICNGATATLVPSGASSYVFSSGANTVSPISNSTYSISGTNAAGCTSSAVAISSVIVNPLPGVTAGGISIICLGKSTTITAGSADTYSWSSGASGSVAVLSPTTNTTYSVTGTNTTTGCSATAVLNITVNPVPLISAANASICQGATHTFTPSGGTSYVWAPNGPVVNPGTTTTYTLVGANAFGCTTAINPAVTVYSLPVISVNSGTICAGTVFTMTPSGAVSYNYSAPGTSTVNPSASTQYSVYGTSSNGCTSTVAAISSVTVFNLPVISVNSGSICSGQVFTMNPSGAFNYVYSSPGTATVSPSATTQYSVTGTSTAGCSSSVPAISTVTVYQRPTITVNSGTICEGGVFTMNPSGAATYQFSGPGTSTVSPLTNTQYSVSGTSTAGCTSTTSAIASVTVYPLPFISITSGTICQGNSFNLLPSGGANYTFINGSAVVSPTATTTYSAFGSSSFGCVSQTLALATVSVYNSPTVTVNSGSICSGQVFTIQASGAATYNYSSGSNTVNPIITTAYSVTGTSTAGCVSASVAICNVTVETTPSITVSSGTICAGESYSFTVSGASSYSYQGGAVQVSPLSTSNYTVVGYSLNNCPSSAETSTVTVNALPVINALFTPSAVCSGNSLVPVANGAQTYTWSNSLTNNTAFVPTTSKTYTVTGIDANGCKNYTTTSLTVYTLPQLTINSSNAVSCEAETVTITVSGANTYTWSNSQITNNISPSNTITTTYTVTGTDLNNCSNSSVFTQSVISCNQSFNAFATVTDVECSDKKNGSISVDASAGYKDKTIEYIWYNTSHCPSNDCSKIDSLDEGIYSVKVKLTYTLNGFFVKRDSITIGALKVEDKNGPCDITVFKGISVNADNHNDNLFVENIETFPKNKVTIFNRWGNLISEIEGYNNVERIWPNPEEKEKLPASTYFYIIDLGNGSKPVKGWIEIIKN